MKPCKKAVLKRFLSEENSLESVEYAVMTAIIVGALVLALIGLAGAMTDKFTETQQILEGAN